MLASVHGAWEDTPGQVAMVTYDPEAAVIARACLCYNIRYMMKLSNIAA